MSYRNTDSELKNLLTYKENSNIYSVSSIKAAQILVENTFLRTIRFYSNNIYLYDWNNKYYEKVTIEHLRLLISSILKKGNSKDFQNPTYIENIIGSLKLDSAVSFFNKPKINNDIIVFENGVFNLGNKTLSPHSPSFFATSDNALFFPYLPNKDCKKFLSYLSKICNHNKILIEYLRSYFYISIYFKFNLKMFLDFLQEITPPTTTSNEYLLLSGIGSVLIGKEETFIATLRNYPLFNSKNSILNLKTLNTDIPSNQNEEFNKVILHRLIGSDFFDELPGLFNWVVSLGKKKGINLFLNHFLKDNISSIPFEIGTKVKDTLKVKKEMVDFPLFWGRKDSQLIDPLFENSLNTSTVTPVLSKKVDSLFLGRWAKEELIAGEGTYVGFTNKIVTEKPLKFEKKKLYPAYMFWLNKHHPEEIPLSHRNFSKFLIKILEKEGITCIKTRKYKGAYIKGVILKN